MIRNLLFQPALIRRPSPARPVLLIAAAQVLLGGCNADVGLRRAWRHTDPAVLHLTEQYALSVADTIAIEDVTAEPDEE